MKLDKIFEDRKSDEAETVRKVSSSSGKLGDLITSAQAAKILGVEMSRIRQLVGDGKLKSYGPEAGRRDHMFKRSDIQSLKSKEKDKGGRPEGS